MTATVIDHGLFIGGKSIPAAPGRTIENTSPIDGAQLGSVADATTEQVRDAIDTAAAVFRDEWSRVNGATRAKLMNNFADLLESEAEELGALETLDNGKLLRETSTQAKFAARNYRFFAGMADKIFGTTIPMDNPDLFDYTVREPVGVAALITAWNSPMQLLANKLAPALAAGNCVVVKPSEFAPLTTLRTADLLKRAGFPDGVFNVITGGVEAGQALTSNPRLGRISFTGSVETGRAIARAAAENIVPVTLELGGKSPNIIFADADIDRAVVGAVAGIFSAGGQSCIAGSRLLVHVDVYDRVVSAIAKAAAAIRVGDPRLPETQIGPVANRAHYERIRSAIVAAEGAGTEILVGGSAAIDTSSAGLFVAPTVFSNVDPMSDLAQNEIFGPVLSCIPFTTEDEAIAIANSTAFGLASGIWTKDLSRAHRLARRIEAGTVWINTYRTSGTQAPFGGKKLSGYGRERGVEAIEEYLTTKNVMIDLSDSARDPFAISV